jgi:hypothetical protein
MAKTGVTSNIPKAMREFQSGFDKLQKELLNREATLAVMTMDNVNDRGLVKGELNKDGSYADIKQAVSGIISYSKPLKRGGRSKPRRIFAKNRIAVRKSKLLEVFEHKVAFRKTSRGLEQRRTDAKIKIQNFKDGKKTITFEFFGTSGRSLRNLSVGQRRTQTVTTAEGKELRGRKGKRDVVRNNIRRTFVGGHNKALQKYIDSKYAKDFRKIGK